MARKYKSGAKRINGIDRYNPIIDDYNPFSREDVMRYKDDLHKRLFPEKYNEKGERVHV